jgi:hypothetical protein
MQPCLAHPKIASYGRNRDAHDFGNLLRGHPAKIFKLDNPALALVDRSERLKSQIERHDVGRLLIQNVHSLVKCDLQSAASFLGVSPSCVIDQDAPHDGGCDREEVRAVLPRDAGMVDQLQKRFVHQRRWLHGDIPALTPDPEFGHAKQFVINQRSEAVEGVASPLFHSTRILVMSESIWRCLPNPGKSHRDEILPRGPCTLQKEAVKIFLASDRIRARVPPCLVEGQFTMKRYANRLITAGSALAFLASLANAGQDLITVKDLNPFTHVVRIPADADLSSIRFEQAKLVMVPTKVRFAENARYCEQLAFRDPGGSLYCPYAAFEGTTPAYEITCSYDGPAMTSDEFGGKHFTFFAYFRPEDLTAATRRMFSGKKAARSDLAAVFHLTSSREPERRVVIDETNSRFCEGNYVDGAWQRKDAQCDEIIKYKAVTVPPEYVTIRIGLSGTEQAFTATAEAGVRR